RTLKGKGILEEEDKPGFHGKPIEPAEQAEKVIESLQRGLTGADHWEPRLPTQGAVTPPGPVRPGDDPPYSPSSKPEATRKAFGAALASLGKANPAIVALDGDVKNSTYTEDFAKACPEHFF